MDYLMIHLPIAGVDMMSWQLILIGLTVGVIGGFFGVGGAFMVTPALNVFGFPMAYAIGTDMAHIAGKSVVATIKHRKLGNVDLKLGLWMVVFTAVGIELGATLIMWLEKIGRVGPIVRVVYMVLLFGLGSYMLYEFFGLSRKSKNSGGKITDAGTSPLALRLHEINLPPMIHLKTSGITISLWVIGGIATFTGFLAGFLGVGGGFIRMPALIYLIGCPTTVAVGTDLFEVMISGAYGAFTYALKGRVEIVAAVIMLCGAAVGAQFGTLATKYVKGLIIRFYFAVTMLLSGVSVVFKHISAGYKNVYSGSLNAWVKTTTGLTDKEQIKDWLLMNKAAVKTWIVQQPDVMQSAYAMEKMWNNYSGYLMLGSATALSILIVVKMFQGVMYERRLHATEYARESSK
ncbi:sulfite exporter TauE/SafE family protein [Candidatus Magnetobacterium casense]|uniref:sulfite exporter TauE/SafE family protein n=1 Tax=Candidatus Magnetobacterium casense TaxID=1455061 RepID=UPI001C48BA1B|nr:sulfite exporter TauE/SafE family protein [Candidatus Magnetobacterium casensis]